MRARGPAGFLGDRGGVAAIEAALVISLILVPLCLAVADLGTALADDARLDRALQAAVYYVWNNPAGFTTAGIAGAAAAGYGSASPTLTVTSSTACSCISSGYLKVSAVSCSGTCPTNEAVATYVTVTASATFTLPIKVAYLISPLSRTVSGTVRTQ